MSGAAAKHDEAGAERLQAPVVDFLGDPATHGGEPVTQVVTHISRIFLAGPRAWKLKRAIRTNYLDFSTLENRERICRREIEVNANATDIYVGVVPVTRDHAGLRLGGEGDPVEWLVEMRRFDRELELDRLEEGGRLTAAIIEWLADQVAALQAGAQVVTDYGDAQDVRARIEQIAGALAQAEGGGRAADWSRLALAECDRRVRLIDRRQSLGRVRRCHGDLHLGNIVMIGGRPTPFDAIEFNEAIASIDVLYDLALTLSDLLLRGQRQLANALLSRYLGATRDHAGLSLIPLFLSMRGAVQAMTARSRHESGQAARALAFAVEALEPRPRPRLIAIGGSSGSGKTTLARALAPEVAPLTGAVVIRSDVVRKRLAGLAPERALAPESYTPARDRRVLTRMACDARSALRAGVSVVLDATFLAPEARGCVRSLARAAGVRFDGIWLKLPTAAAARRVGQRNADASDATAEVVRRQAERASAPADWTPLDASGAPDEVLAGARQALEGRS